MGRKRTLRAVLITLILTILIVGGIAFFLSNSILSKKNAEIAELQSMISEDEAYVFVNDIKAGSIITPEDIDTSIVLQNSITSGMYMLSGAAPWIDENGNMHQKADYYTIDEDGNESKIPVIIDDAIVGRQVKANISANTPVLEALLYAKNEIPSKDERLEEFNYINIPSNLNAGDYCDIRIRFATGEDFTVLVGKKVEAVAGETTIFLKLNEEEIMLMSSATIEAYINAGATLYANKYSDPATQLYKESIENYVEKYDAAVVAALEAKDAEKALELMKESGDATIDDFNALPEEQKASLKARITATKEEELSLDDIAAYASIARDHVEAIKNAKETKNEDVLIYYKYMRVQRRVEIAKSYAVKDEVLKAINANPNLVETVKGWFNERYTANSASGIVTDQYKKLEAQLKTAPEVSYDPNVKSQAQIREEMNSLIAERATLVENKNAKELTERKARRVAYLEELINGD